MDIRDNQEFRRVLVRGELVENVFVRIGNECLLPGYYIFYPKGGRPFPVALTKNPDDIELPWQTNLRRRLASTDM